jgi:5'-nucleotidase
MIQLRALYECQLTEGFSAMGKHILVTNDDGVQAPSLLALVKVMRKLGDVTVVAPDRNWSASGHVKTLYRPIMVRETTLADGSEAITTDGAPSDCVALALMGMIERPVDLVVSGINPNANIGDDITYSGTVTAAMEAVLYRVPGIAFSVDAPQDNEKADYDATAAYCRDITERVLEKGLPQHVLLNVNIPLQPQVTVKGIKITRQGKRIYKDELVRYKDPRGRSFYWIGGEVPSGETIDGSDYTTLKQGYISITPLQMDMTAERFINELRTWEF